MATQLKQDLASLRLERPAPPAPGRRWRPALVVALLLVVGGFAYLAWSGAGRRSVELEAARAAIETFPQGASGVPVLTASGYIVPRRKAVVSAKIQGRLAELRVEEGSRVLEGGIIARLDSAAARAEVRSAEAAIQGAEADLAERRRQLRLARELAAERIVSDDDLEAAGSRVRISEAALAQARAGLGLSRARLEDTVIRAPFTGVVLKKMAEVGESVAPIPPGVNLSTSSGAIVALADLDTLEVEADVSEANVADLQPDQPAEVAVEAFPDRSFRAVLRQVIPTADRTRATVQVKVTILDKDADLKPEMTARVTFLRPADPARTSGAATFVTVPEETIVQRAGRPVVFEIIEGRARERRVSTGLTRQGRIAVHQGLAGHEMLALRPPDTLRDGDAVRVRR